MSDDVEDAKKYSREQLSRVSWLLRGDYPDPPEWELLLIGEMMRRAMNGDDVALEALKKRFPPAEARRRSDAGHSLEFHLTPTRIISGLKFDVISPSVYRLAGIKAEVFIVYLPHQTRGGWYICHQEKEELLRSRRFSTVAEAASTILRVLRSLRP